MAVREEALQAALAACEQRMAQAHLDLDLEAIDRLLHPDYVILQPDGQFQSKAEVLAFYASGTRRWELARVDRVEARVYGRTGVVRGYWRARGENAGVRFDYAARFISVWRWEAGRWRNLTYQAVEVEAGEEEPDGDGAD